MDKAEEFTALDEISDNEQGRSEPPSEQHKHEQVAVIFYIVTRCIVDPIYYKGSDFYRRDSGPFGFLNLNWLL